MNIKYSFVLCGLIFIATVTCTPIIEENEREIEKREKCFSLCNVCGCQGYYCGDECICECMNDNDNDIDCIGGLKKNSIKMELPFEVMIQGAGGSRFVREKMNPSLDQMESYKENERKGRSIYSIYKPETETEAKIGKGHLVALHEENNHEARPDASATAPRQPIFNFPVFKNEQHKDPIVGSPYRVKNILSQVRNLKFDKGNGLVGSPIAINLPSLPSPPAPAPDPVSAQRPPFMIFRSNPIPLFNPVNPLPTPSRNGGTTANVAVSTSESNIPAPELTAAVSNLINSTKFEPVVAAPAPKARKNSPFVGASQATDSQPPLFAVGRIITPDPRFRAFTDRITKQISIGSGRASQPIITQPAHTT